MAVPKRKTSRSNTRHRRARWKAAVPALVPVAVDGVRRLVPQHLVRAHERGLLRPEGRPRPADRAGPGILAPRTR